MCIGANRPALWMDRSAATGASDGRRVLSPVAALGFTIGQARGTHFGRFSPASG